MIDIENDIYDIVAKALRTQFPGIAVSNEYTGTSSKFPAVTFVEADNRVLAAMRTTVIENAAELMYEVNVFSNRAAGKKSEAKAIANAVDEVMNGLGFTRMFREQVPNLKDATVYRIVLRYEGAVGPGAEGKYLIYQNY